MIDSSATLRVSLLQSLRSTPMKKNSFLTIFISTHILLIILQIYKHTLFVKNNYNQQQCDKKLAMLTEKKQMLTQELHALKDRDYIKKYAQEKLNMRPYALNQVKKL
jgi:cell division protein FtsB